MISESIPDPDVGVCSIWSRRGYLSIRLCNLMGHNEDVVSECLSHPTLDKGEKFWYYTSMDSSQLNRRTLKS